MQIRYSSHRACAIVRGIPPPRAFKLEHDLLASLFILWTGCGLLKLPLVKAGCLQHVYLCAKTTCIPFDCTAAIPIDVPMYRFWTKRRSFGKPWILQNSSSVVEVLACQCLTCTPKHGWDGNLHLAYCEETNNPHLRRATNQRQERGPKIAESKRLPQCSISSALAESPRGLLSIPSTIDSTNSMLHAMHVADNHSQIVHPG